jgi:hypothetical protein
LIFSASFTVAQARLLPGRDPVEPLVGAVAGAAAFGDPVGLAHSWRVIAHVYNRRLQWAELERVGERIVAYARRAGDRRTETRILGGIAAGLAHQTRERGRARHDDGALEAVLAVQSDQGLVVLAGQAVYTVDEWAGEPDEEDRRGLSERSGQRQDRPGEHPRSCIG